MPATRYLGPVLGDLHLFFHRLGPVLAKDLLLTGRTPLASELAHLGVFTRCVPAAQVVECTEEMATLIAKMPADGIVIAKEAYRLVESSMGMGLAEVSSYLLHAYGTNLQFEDDEFNFVRSRSKSGGLAARASTRRSASMPTNQWAECGVSGDVRRDDAGPPGDRRRGGRR